MRRRSGRGRGRAEFGVKHLSGIDCNEFGTPLLNSAFAQVSAIAQNPLLVYVNADIMLLSDFTAAIQDVQAAKFMLIGQRWDVAIDKEWDFKQPDWESSLLNHVKPK